MQHAYAGPNGTEPARQRESGGRGEDVRGKIRMATFITFIDNIMPRHAGRRT